MFSCFQNKLQMITNITHKKTSKNLTKGNIYFKLPITIGNKYILKMTGSIKDQPTYNHVLFKKYFKSNIIKNTINH